MKKSLGRLNTFKKSLNVKDAPRPSINNAKATGAIVVTIPTYPQMKLIIKKNYLYIDNG